MLSATVFGALMAMVNLCATFDSTVANDRDSHTRAIEHVEPVIGQLAAPWYRVDGDYRPQRQLASR